MYPPVGRRVNSVGGAVESRTAKVGRRCVFTAVVRAKRREPSTTVKVCYYYYRRCRRRRRRRLFYIIIFFPVVRTDRARARLSRSRRRPGHSRLIAARSTHTHTRANRPRPPVRQTAVRKFVTSYRRPLGGEKHVSFFTFFTRPSVRKPKNLIPPPPPPRDGGDFFERAERVAPRPWFDR